MKEIADNSKHVPSTALFRVLREWLNRNYDDTKYGPPTLRMLVVAVSLPIGGDNYALARNIAEKKLSRDTGNNSVVLYCRV